MKDGGGGTYGSGETSSGRSMRLHHLLREMAKKYDQYDEYMQQDAHELLRHLLDSMEMEEKDIIKRVQPQPPLGKNKRRRKLPKDGISPMASPLPSPAPSAPSSPTRKATILPTPRDLDGHLGLGEPHSQAVEIKEIPENEMLIPFVDVLFGGLLASVVVCENCKSVSILRVEFGRNKQNLSGIPHV
jgi:ubiquitin carboxyl-terminal hydrolase 16/45